MIETKLASVVNSTKLLEIIPLSTITTTTTQSSSTLPSSSSPPRGRTVINAIYIAGIVFMVVVFLLLLWVNLFSRRCWSWHDTPVINRFNRQWLLRRRMNQTNNTSPKSRHQGQLSDEDELK